MSLSSMFDGMTPEERAVAMEQSYQNLALVKDHAGFIDDAFDGTDYNVKVALDGDRSDPTPHTTSNAEYALAIRQMADDIRTYNDEMSRAVGPAAEAAGTAAELSAVLSDFCSFQGMPTWAVATGALSGKLVYFQLSP